MRLIDADAIQIPKTGMEVFETCRLCETTFPKVVREIIDNAPTIEPKRGEWIDKCGNKVCVCSNCGKDYDHTYEWIERWNFCPNCGADMREREGE